MANENFPLPQYNKKVNYCNGTDIVILNFMLDLLSCMNDKDKQQVCGNIMSASCLAQARINHAFSLQIQNNADVLLDTGLKLSDIIVTL